MRIVIIGSGNVATVLGRKMILAKHEIIQVFSRKEEHAALLAKELNCSHAISPGALDTNGDVYVLAISDDSLFHVHSWLTLRDLLIVHMAGSVPMDVLKPVSRRYGVLYPLQSLRKELRAIPEIPFLIDGSDEETGAILLGLANTLSGNVSFANDEQREKLHLAAVVTNNFTNHLYSLAQNYCDKEKVDFKMLLPLIEETNKRLSPGPASQFQTGPAIRNDQVTMDHHLAMLKDHPVLSALYVFFSKSIQAMYAGE